MSTVKSILATVVSRSGLAKALFTSLGRTPYIRVVNYHGTPQADAASLQRHLAYYQQHFHPVGRNDLDRFLRERYWPHPKPGLIISFDDGLRSNYDVAYPLLRAYGFPGWFFVPVEFITCPVEQQEAFSHVHRIRNAAHYADQRIAMSVADVRHLQQDAVIGCHTASHCRAGAEVDPIRLHAEITASRLTLSRLVGADIDIFCWVGGEETSYSATAAAAIRAAGYRYAFMTNTAPIRFDTHPLQLQRTNIEASWPLSLVQFQLCGIMDVLYHRKRQRINRMTAVDAVPQ